MKTPMPKIYVAVKDDTEDHIASGSLTTIKERLRKYPETQWTIKTLQLKADVPTICSLIENWSSVKPSEEDRVRILPSGQVRSVKQKDGDAADNDESEDEEAVS